MPLGWEKINEKRPSPNKNIVFIKPLKGALEPQGQIFLERIAAQCLPVMNKHHLAVTSLEEYEPNFEFWGRNFNNGEVIQLVLKSPTTRRWLPFRFVQMVMMHELAHIKQMNHSKAFWKVRNEFADDMRALWVRGYTGDGFFGRGVLLSNGEFDQEELDTDEVLPEHLCGGTFKSRGGKKRKAKPKITYKERQERRIKKKFGTNGTALGADDAAKVKLEKGKKPAGKPRVAGSARGRELRAAAALARFDQVKKEEPDVKDEDLVTDSEAESLEDGSAKPNEEDAVDIDGRKLLDRHGRGMIKVCEDEDNDEDYVKEELSELRGLAQIPEFSEKPEQPSSRQRKSQRSLQSAPSTAAIARSPPLSIGDGAIGIKRAQQMSEASDNFLRPGLQTQKSSPSNDLSIDNSKDTDLVRRVLTCQICTTDNTLSALTCIACAHVLQPSNISDTWRCRSESCRDTEYVNAGDAGLCGLCWTPKPAD